MASELDHAKATLKRLFHKAHIGDVPSVGPQPKAMIWTADDDAELDWAIDQIVREAADRGRGQIQ